MVDMKMTVKGYLVLESEYRKQRLACLRHNPPEGSEARREADRYGKLADEMRLKAYDLMGVVTIPLVNQRSFFESL